MAVMEISTEFNVHHDERTILGPCPACESWQVDYEVDPLLEAMSINDFYEMLEGVLREHYNECAHLRMIFPDL